MVKPEDLTTRKILKFRFRVRMRQVGRPDGTERFPFRYGEAGRLDDKKNFELQFQG
jgi:hypothetical protein